MHPETHLALHRARAAELRADADAHRVAAPARRRRDLRTRLGWTLVEVGLRLTATPGTAAAAG
ncbi:hypothetical protein RKE30_39255 [Streptomyces sp. Li-HN-5-11]|uniref:hypothetical protein n=1 Tax=Streptomyces sp. Li-HN-5-11 TaxID=3075432 RepID=UPI0028B09091|nr:hypothetical protein [Streptomyces sp. Li-HN-5-11]WNM35965.1 hypothetical protein RKE30_39255 [Streptomyces sp. Li-HN-5-11]